ncbi:MAG: lysophospholipid acyltransferase family protein [Pseudomonadota bacterium]
MKLQNTSYQGSKSLLRARSALFFIAMTLATVIVGPTMLLAAPLPFRYRYGLAQIWVTFVLWAVKAICGLDYRVVGAENIPSGNGIVLCKHQSAWETIALQKIFPPQVFLLKRELLWLPIWGWAMATLEPIAINRKSKKQALRTLLKHGADRLRKGLWVVIFPEGTRVAPGQQRKFNAGGGMLSHATGYPVIPVAHNAGEFWARYGFLKYPGTIELRIGPAIPSEGRRAADINRAAEDWIRTQMNEISAA